MYLKIFSHPIFINLNFHMPMIVDLSHPLVMLEGENGSGKSTLLHSIYLAMREEQVESYAYKLDKKGVELGKVLLFDASSTTRAITRAIQRRSADERVHYLRQPRTGDVVAVPRNIPVAAGWVGVAVG
jgi:predicted ATPase